LGQILDGLAWDPDGQILYGLGSYSKPRLFRIDTTTWQATYVAPVNTTYVYYGSFTYDRDRATLWGIDINRRLIRIDPATGAVTDTGPTGIFPSALAYHPVLHRLFAVDLAGSDHLYELNVSTGAGTLVGAIGFTDLAGLTFDPSTGLLLSCDTATDQFVQIDPLSGAGVALGRARCCVSALTVPY
jgi:hypothetical protein